MGVQSGLPDAQRAANPHPYPIAETPIPKNSD